jgi:hypothetical protein
MNAIVPTTGKSHKSLDTRGGTRVPPRGAKCDDESLAVLDLKLLALTHPWLEDEITGEVHRLHNEGVPFGVILETLNGLVDRFDVQAKATWERMKQKRDAMIHDRDLRKTLIPQSPMEAELFAAMDKTDAIRDEIAAMRSATVATIDEVAAMRRETAAMDDDFAREMAEQQARIDAINGEADASDARAKATVDRTKKKWWPF